MRDEINLPEEKLDKEKANALEEKNGLLDVAMSRSHKLITLT
jgi:hypothetical protein